MRLINRSAWYSRRFKILYGGWRPHDLKKKAKQTATTPGHTGQRVIYRDSGPRSLRILRTYSNVWSLFRVVTCSSREHDSGVYGAKMRTSLKTMISLPFQAQLKLNMKAIRSWRRKGRLVCHTNVLLTKLKVAWAAGDALGLMCCRILGGR